MAELGRESIRRNPLIADLLHRIEFIEKAGHWHSPHSGRGAGTGAAQNRNLRFGEPFSSLFSGRIPKCGHQKIKLPDKSPGKLPPKLPPQVTPQDTGIARLLEIISGEMNRRQIQEALDLKNTKHVRKTYLSPALQAGLIEMTIPDKPRSSKQRYRLTTAGREYLHKSKGQDNGED